MYDFVKLAVDCAKTAGASYADARIVLLKSQDISVRNGELKSFEQAETEGIGIRVIADGGWGFASTRELTKDSILETAHQAIKTARASSSIKGAPAQLVAENFHTAEWNAPCKIDPFKVSTDKKINDMIKIDSAVREVKGITLSSVVFNFVREEKYFASSEGSLIKQCRTKTGMGTEMGVFADGEYQYRSYPICFGGQYSLAGYELLDQLDFIKNAPICAQQAVELIKAPVCPSGEMDLILDSDQLALQVHESVGHPIELDRVLGTEANFAGMSFLTLEKLNNFKYGSDKMNIVADARIEHGASIGAFGFDDEGVPAQRTDIVKNGVFTGYLSSRETAKQIGLTRSGGTMRASGWNRLPLIRMTQVSILPGDKKFNELVQDIKDGVFMSTNKSWSIDDKRLNFQFACEIGWLIKNGKIAGMVKNPSYAGITPVFWGSLDAVCDANYWKLWGIPNCGKGQPMQLMDVSHGAAPARFRKIKIGVTK
ncbi:MAG: TldD/PmbA family protein [Planctomycetes bacterium]|nr:TldD/PmbA family protein [Planctomycetota bacterium]